MNNEYFFIKRGKHKGCIVRWVTNILHFGQFSGVRKKQFEHPNGKKCTYLDNVRPSFQKFSNQTLAHQVFTYAQRKQ